MIFSEAQQTEKTKQTPSKRETPPYICDSIAVGLNIFVPQIRRFLFICDILNTVYENRGVKNEGITSRR